MKTFIIVKREELGPYAIDEEIWNKMLSAKSLILKKPHKSFLIYEPVMGYDCTINSWNIAMGFNLFTIIKYCFVEKLKREGS